jgi:hypothetical protein
MVSPGVDSDDYSIRNYNDVVDPWSMIESSLIQRTPGMMATQIDEDVVILCLPINCYVTLDQFGRRVWELIEQPITLGHLVEKLEEEYEADAGEIRRDVEAFLLEIAGDGLVTFDPSTDPLR